MWPRFGDREEGSGSLSRGRKRTTRTSAAGTAAAGEFSEHGLARCGPRRPRPAACAPAAQDCENSAFSCKRPPPTAHRPLPFLRGLFGSRDAPGWGIRPDTAYVRPATPYHRDTYFSFFPPRLPPLHPPILRFHPPPRDFPCLPFRVGGEGAQGRPPGSGLQPGQRAEVRRLTSKALSNLEGQVSSAIGVAC